MDHFAEAEREVGDEMHRRHDLADRQLGQRRERVIGEFEARGAGPPGTEAARNCRV